MVFTTDNIIYGGDGADSLSFSGNYNNSYIDLGEGEDTVTTGTRTIKGSAIIGGNNTNTMATANPKLTDVYTQGFILQKIPFITHWLEEKLKQL